MRSSLTPGLVVAAGLAWGLRLGLDPGPFGPGPAGLVAITAVLAPLIAGSGMLLAGGRWSRRLGMATTAGGFVLAAVMPFDAGGATALLLTIGAAAGLLFWRDATPERHSRPEIPAAAVITAVGLIWMPAVAGAAAPGAAAPAHWILAAVALGGAWMYVRAHLSGLWLVRTALLPLAAWAAVLSPPAGAVVLIAAAALVTAVAWTDGARRAADPLLRDRSPASNPFAAATRGTRR